VFRLSQFKKKVGKGKRERRKERVRKKGKRRSVGIRDSSFFSWTLMGEIE